jgi:hypothetical protein
MVYRVVDGKLVDVHPVDEWLDEVEVFSLRGERLIADIQRDPYEIRIWLKAAYDLGYEEAATEAAEIAAGASL